MGIPTYTGIDRMFEAEIQYFTSLPSTRSFLESVDTAGANAELADYGLSLLNPYSHRWANRVTAIPDAPGVIDIGNSLQQSVEMQLTGQLATDDDFSKSFLDGLYSTSGVITALGKAAEGLDRYLRLGVDSGSITYYRRYCKILGVEPTILQK